jgi:hypothetical protein
MAELALNSTSARELVRAFIAGFGVDAGNVSECVIEPWGVTITTYRRNEQGERVLDPDRRIARATQHYPMDLPVVTP